MRTKTLLLTAALSAAGVATSMAQAVYSVNAVGYVNTTLQPGFNLISNPLIAADNSVDALFSSLKAIDGVQIFKFNNKTGYTSWGVEFGELSGAQDPKKVTVMPGEGVFVQIPTGTPATTVTFIGDVPQGTTAAPLNTPIPSGFSILSSQVPQAGAADTVLGLPAPSEGDQYFKYDATAHKYNSSGFEFGEWSTPLSDPKLALGVGDAFFYSNAGADKTWSRVFSVNQ